MGCYLQFCIIKKLRPVRKNLSKVQFFHILSAHAKGLIDSETGRSPQWFVNATGQNSITQKLPANVPRSFSRISGLVKDAFSLSSPRSFNVYGLWAVWPLLKSRIPGKIDMVRVRSK